MLSQSTVQITNHLAEALSIEEIASMSIMISEITDLITNRNTMISNQAIISLQQDLLMLQQYGFIIKKNSETIAEDLLTIELNNQSLSSQQAMLLQQMQPIQLPPMNPAPDSSSSYQPK